MLVLLKSKQILGGVYMIENKDGKAEIWITGDPIPVYEKLENIEVICK